MGKIYTVDEITAAVKPIAEKYGIDKVWLFGSYARGEATSSGLTATRTQTRFCFSRISSARSERR